MKPQKLVVVMFHHGFQLYRKIQGALRRQRRWEEEADGAGINGEGGRPISRPTKRTQF
jgi:hypothetical protein